MESRRSVQFVSVYVIYCSRLTERPRRRAARTGRSSGGGTDDDGGAGATQPSPWAGGGGVAPGRCWLPSPRAGGSAGLCCLACRRPGPVPAAIATGWQRCRHGPPGRHRRAKLRAMCSPSPCREQGGGVALQEQPPAHRATEIKFTLGLLTSVQCAENVGTKFTQEMQKLQKSLLTVRSAAEKVYTTGQNIEK